MWIHDKFITQQKPKHISHAVRISTLNKKKESNILFATTIQEKRNVPSYTVVLPHLEYFCNGIEVDTKTSTIYTESFEIFKPMRMMHSYPNLSNFGSELNFQRIILCVN